MDRQIILFYVRYSIGPRSVKNMIQRQSLNGFKTKIIPDLMTKSLFLFLAMEITCLTNK